MIHVKADDVADDAPLVVAVPDVADAADAAADAAAADQIFPRVASFSLPPQKLSHNASVAICHEPTHTKDTTTPRNVLE